MENVMPRKADAYSVDATIHYLGQMAQRPQVWNEDFSRNILTLEGVTMRIEDAGARERAPDLGTEGFALVPHKTDVASLSAPAASMEAYLDELRSLLLALTRADHIDMATASVVRTSARSAVGTETSPAVPFVHCDCSEAGLPGMLQWAYPPAPAKPRRRMALYNLWRLLSPGPTGLPLAVCDARTFARDDIVPGSSHFTSSSFTAEAVFVRPNAAHRWFYFPRMTSAEVLIFKQYDSDRRYPSQVPHTAFDNRALFPEAPPRVSVESRAVAYWYEEGC